MAPPGPSSPHKPRSGGTTRRKGLKLTQSNPSAGTSTHDVVKQSARPAFPLAAFLWPTKDGTSQWIVLPLLLMVVGLFRWAAGLWGYSGFNSPPMHGDFEAQRHWMEITTGLPVSQWYFYDLPWWGLDYPPLTAYHSWLLGKIGSLINAQWFELDTSRRLDLSSLKVYMRATVLASEYLAYVVPVVLLSRRLNQSNLTHSIALVAILLQPSTILIDHAHFQYNTVMLGFFAFSILGLISQHRLAASFCFVLALSFKQMGLYYAPAVFAVLLGSCVFPRQAPVAFVSIGAVTILSFALVFAPLLLGAAWDAYRGLPLPAWDAYPHPITSTLFAFVPPLQPLLPPNSHFLTPLLVQLDQSVHRIFPFARGLFEDKVANIWCTLNIVYKLKHLPTALLQRASLLLTLTAVSPPSLILFKNPAATVSVLFPCLAATAWGFFMCAFQVHEKSVLLPLFPMTLLLATKRGLTPSIRAWVGWANAIGAWTMFPLIKRDELRVPYMVLTALWAWLLGLPPFSLNVYKGKGEESLSLLVRAIHLLFYALMLAWHIVEALVDPPPGKPDLWIVINVGIGAAGFGLCYLWCLWLAAKNAGYLEGSSKKSPAPKGKEN
ncbi:MAG: Glucosyltransferase-like protein [Vezdaea aestivalis]|nr:MAG: Glucosyltransferase-like protein [Vezdaea aestivalis]